MSTQIKLTKEETVHQLTQVIVDFFKDFEEDPIDSESDNELCRRNENFFKEYHCATTGADPDEKRLDGFAEADYKYFVKQLPQWEIGVQGCYDCFLGAQSKVGGTSDQKKWWEWLNLKAPCPGKHFRLLPNLICHLTSKENETSKMGFLHFLMRWYLIGIYGSKETGAPIPDNMTLSPIRTSMTNAVHGQVVLSPTQVILSPIATAMDQSSKVAKTHVIKSPTDRPIKKLKTEFNVG